MPTGQFWPTTGGHAIQEEGTLLTSRRGLNFIGTGVTATDDAANNRTLITISSGGTTISSGTAAPTSGVGSDGDYYLDADNNILYGPKDSSGYGPNQSIYTDQTGTANTTGTGAYTLGSDVTFTTAGIITALLFKKPVSNTVTTHTLRVWNIDTQALIGSATTSDETGLSGWMTATLATPISVTAGQTIRLSFDSPGLQDIYTNTGQVINGDLVNPAREFYQVGVNIYPSLENTPIFHTMLDLVFRAQDAGMVWPIAIQSGGGHIIQEEGSGLTQRSKLNFVGANVTVTDDAANDRTVVTIVGGSPARQTASITTSSLADQATATGTVLLSKSYRIIRIVTDRPARVRLYTTTAKRDADVLRAAGVMPTGDHGLCMDFVTVSGDLDWDTSPAIDGSDGKSTPDGIIPWTITNLSGSTSTVAVTLHWIATE